MSDFGQRLIKTVREVAAERPDFVFQGACRYVANGEPACLVGHALWRLGEIDASLEGTERNDEGIDFLLDTLERFVAPDEVDWLATAQASQDDRSPWGSAAFDADSLAEDNDY